MTQQENVSALTQEVSDAYEKSDILVYFGPVMRPWDDYIIDLCAKRRKRQNVLLMLTTLGGDAHAAYRIGRCLRRSYCAPQAKGIPSGTVTIFVNGVCASAGTLLTLASDKLILSEHTELGPIDVQIRKPDEVGEQLSGLTPIQALTFLENETQKFFKASFESLRYPRGLSFSTRLAAATSSKLATGLMGRLYEQIDPLRLAEYDRSNQIGFEYGERIKTKNVRSDAVERLLRGYPSHDFCIDSEEARELFQKVEAPNDKLEALGNLFKPVSDKYLGDDETATFYLNEELPDAAVPNDHEKPQTSRDESAGNTNGKKEGDHRGNDKRRPAKGPMSAATRRETIL